MDLILSRSFRFFADFSCAFKHPTLGSNCSLLASDFVIVADDKCLGIENFTEAKCHSERSEESQSPAKV